MTKRVRPANTVKNPHLHPGLPPVHPLEAVLAARGECVHHPHKEWWTTNHRQNRYAPEYQEAKDVCATCPVRSACRKVIDHLEAHLPQDGRWMAGIWAGEGPYERVARRKEPGAKAAA